MTKGNSRRCDSHIEHQHKSLSTALLSALSISFGLLASHMVVILQVYEYLVDEDEEVLLDGSTKDLAGGLLRELVDQWE